jgi:hypothetical protein
MSDIVSFPQAASQELIAKLVKAGYLEAGFALTTAMPSVHDHRPGHGGGWPGVS